MANLTTATVAGNTSMAQKLVAACAGPEHLGGATVKAFTCTLGTGNFPLAGIALDLSALCPNKVLAVVTSPIYDPDLTTGDTAFRVVYVPSSTGAPATGVLYAYAATGVMVADDTVNLGGFVLNGFVIGY